jgi:hypothetical protein
VKLIALPGQEFLAVPIGSHAIELFANPPTRQILVIVPSVGKQQWYSRAIAFG